MNWVKVSTICLPFGKTSTSTFLVFFRWIKIASRRAEIDLILINGISCPELQAYGDPLVQMRWLVRINSLVKILAVSSVNQAVIRIGTMPWKSTRLNPSARLRGRNVARTVLPILVRDIKDRNIKMMTSRIPTPILKASIYHWWDGPLRKSTASSGFDWNELVMAAMLPPLRISSRSVFTG